MINFRNNNFNKLSFKSIERGVWADDGQLKYYNNTRPFREDLNWEKIVKHIAERKTPPKIYCYASSDGSEPYSLAMIMMQRLGKDSAKKYFPIIARDIDEDMVAQTQKRKIIFTNLDVKRIKDILKIKTTNELFEISKTEKGSFGDIVFDIKPLLADCVVFEKGDIMKDAPNLEYDNSMIFFRNVWPYLKKYDAKKLMHIFGEKFTPKTTLITGDYDKNDFEYFEYALYKRAGLTEIEQNIFAKNTPENNRKNWLYEFKRTVMTIPNAIRNLYLDIKY